MKTLPKVKPGGKVAIVSPSFAAPGRWPHVYELGVRRLKSIFDLEAVALPSTKKIGASGAERASDLITAFEDPEILAVIASLGGNDQVTYIKDLPQEPFRNNPKPFFGYSDNSHFANFLWLCGIPSFYGCSLFTEFAMHGRMHNMTAKYAQLALYDKGEFELTASGMYSDIGYDWDDKYKLGTERMWEPSEGWHWDGIRSTSGITWGGCLESVDEMLRHGVKIPTLKQFENIVLLLETSEEIPHEDYVFRVVRGLGGRGILDRVQGVLVGRPKAWEFDKPNGFKQKAEYRLRQRQAILKAVRDYNKHVPVVQNMDFGHTTPQICMPYGSKIRILSETRQIFVRF